jgi:hypothetical protein
LNVLSVNIRSPTDMTDKYPVGRNVISFSPSARPSFSFFPLRLFNRHSISILACAAIAQFRTTDLPSYTYQRPIAKIFCACVFLIIFASPLTIEQERGRER